nr:MAG: putative transmembrane protein [Polycipiviridae sp.]
MSEPMEIPPQLQVLLTMLRTFLVLACLSWQAGIALLHLGATLTRPLAIRIGSALIASLQMRSRTSTTDLPLTIKDLSIHGE